MRREGLSPGGTLRSLSVSAESTCRSFRSAIRSILGSSERTRLRCQSCSVALSLNDLIMPSPDYNVLRY